MSSRRYSICTHSSVTRVFDSVEQQVCDSCKKPSRLGWVYICTEDHDSFLPNHEAAGFFSASNPSVLKRIESTTETPQLNAWIAKAIEDGHYSSEQVKILEEQRANVQKTISSIATTSTDISDDNPWTLLFEQLKDAHPMSSSDNNGFTEPTEPMTKETMSIAVPACRYRCCPACKPVTRDRAWVSLNRVCNDGSYAKGPPEWELQNRRISDVNVVQKLGFYGKGLPTFPSTPNKQVLSNFKEPTSTKVSTRFTPTKKTPRRSSETPRRPSLERRTPLKRTVRGSFSRGNGGLLYFTETPTEDDSIKNPLPTVRTNEPETDPTETVDPDPEGGVPIVTKKALNSSDIMAQV